MRHYWLKRLHTRTSPHVQLLISQCNLVWTPANWSSIATLQLYPGAGMKTTTTQSEFSENVDMVLTSKDSTFNITKFSPLSVQRVVQAMATCSSFGDPHIVTFDGLKFDNYLAGWHTYMQSERTTIQAFHGECGFRSRLCNTIIALQHGGEYLRIMANAPQNTTDLKTEFRFSVENPTQISVDTLNPDSKACRRKSVEYMCTCCSFVH